MFFKLLLFSKFDNIEILEDNCCQVGQKVIEKGLMDQKNSNLMDLKKMREYSQEFVKARDWDKYQTPKNVAMGVAIEASELMEIFQWLSDERSYLAKDDAEKKQQIADEMGDILHYLIRLSTLLDIDLNEAFWQKIKKTEEKYPVDLVKGKKEKYTAYAQ